MAQSVCLVVSAGDRARLEAIVADRNRSRKHVARARLVLLSADRLDVATVARRARVSRPAVWRWQRRYAEAGVDGLLRDKTRKPGKAPLGDDLARRVVALTCAAPPGEVTHWTGRAMAAARGLAALGAAHLGRPQAAAAPHPHLQALARSRLPGQARGDRRALHGPAAARGGPLRRRKTPNPAPRPPPAGPADQARQVRDDDPRLQ